MQTRAQEPERNPNRERTGAGAETDAGVAAGTHRLGNATHNRMSRNGLRPGRSTQTNSPTRFGTHSGAGPDTNAGAVTGTCFGSGKDTRANTGTCSVGTGSDPGDLTRVQTYVHEPERAPKESDTGADTAATAGTRSGPESIKDPCRYGCRSPPERNALWIWTPGGPDRCRHKCRSRNGIRSGRGPVQKRTQESQPERTDWERQHGCRHNRMSRNGLRRGGARKQTQTQDSVLTPERVQTPTQKPSPARALHPKRTQVQTTCTCIMQNIHESMMIYRRAISIYQ